MRRVPHASHGSFNPFAISNKEAHIVNGNINHFEKANNFKENTHSKDDSINYSKKDVEKSAGPYTIINPNKTICAPYSQGNIALFWVKCWSSMCRHVTVCIDI